ncbi:MAG: DMT family transporter [Desulfovibrio sp.]|nr:DMT family transporter [Desulfovibrio sp.]
MLKTSNSTCLGYGAALLATIIWSGNFIAARAFASSIPPCQFNFWRWAIALLALLPFAITQLRYDWQAILRHLRYLSIMALLGVTMMNTFVYKAGQTTESLNMALLMPATPVVILLLARIFYAEPIGPMRLFGMLTALLGILVLVCRGNLQLITSLQVKSGDLWTMGCMLCFALYSLLMRRRPKDLSVQGFNAAVFSLGLIYALPCVFLEIYFLPLPEFSLPLLGGLAYAGLGCSALAFWLWTVGIDRIGPVRAGFIYYSLPLFAGIGSVLILHEEVSLAQVFGGLLIVLGIWLATISATRATT